MKRWFIFGMGVFVGGLLMSIVMLQTQSASAHTVIDSQSVQAMMQMDAEAAAPLLTYQGRLLDPTTGAAKANGSYTIQFKLYDVATGGTPLWTESVNVVTKLGLFATTLGANTPFNQSVFDGRALFLGVAIGGDPEAVPRQPIADVAYAIFARNADRLDGKDASAFAGATHSHDGAQITSGVVAESHIDDSIARDNEVMGIVQANAGSGSGLNADLLDGYDQSAFAKTYSGVQVNQTTALAAGAQAYWFTFGYSANQAVFWRVQPTTIGAKMRLEVESELGSDGNITYWLRVYNTGSIASGYQLIRQSFYQ